MNNKTAVFYFSCIDYDFLYQRPQQLLREWRSNFADLYEFYYVDPPKVRRFVARRYHHLKQSLETLLLKKHNNNGDDAFVLTWLGVPRTFQGHTLPKRISQSALSFRLVDSAVRRMLIQRCGKTQTKVAIVASPFWEPFVS